MKPVSRSKAPVPRAPARVQAPKAKAASSNPALQAPKNFFDRVRDELVHLHPPDVLGAVERELGMYPNASQRADREREIDAKVAGLPLSDSAREALSAIAAQHVSSVDVWQGSHTIIEGDGGALYRKLSGLPEVEKRGSSHYASVKAQQFGIPLGKSELLFGKTADGSTWFQVEAHPFHGGTVTTPLQFVEAWVKNPAHMLDWTKYELTKQNVGPMGLSPHTEQHDPLRIAYSPRE